MRVADLKRMQQRQYPRWIDARYHAVLDHFHVAPAQRIGELSRGERAGLNLALALAQSPELLILDEPTLGLDIVAKRAFLEAVLDATCANDAATIVYCSHQMDEVERLADNLVILERGRVRYMNGPADFCGRIRLWAAAFPFTPPDIWQLPGVLQDDTFGARLKLLGAQSVQAMPLGLDRAVNAFLARGHAGAAHLRTA
jgi:ABC-2 type transport system ATP-binding protein